MYKEGQGVAQDYAEKVRWYKLAAAQGNAKAQLNLGISYDMGEGVAQDYAEAVRWYKLAAAQGNAVAQYNLGTSYGKGQGVVQNYMRAHMWLNLAAVTGDAFAVKNRDIIAARMTPQQIAEAQKLARDCQARNFKNCD
jgi:TPR repeat protein